MKFCPNCGSKTEKLVEGLCEKCFSDNNEIQFKECVIKVCADCDKFQTKNTWLKYTNLKDIVIKRIKKNLKQKYTRIDVDVPKQKSGPGSDTEIMAKLTINDSEFQLPVKLSYALCESCSKATGKYFEGVLQLRNPTEEATKFIKTAIYRSDCHIKQINELKSGLDYYLTCKRFLIKLGRDLQNKLGGELKLSRKLFSQDKQTGKNIYRVTVLVRLPNFEKGDLITVNGEEYRVLNICKKALLYNLETKEKKYFDYSDLFRS